MAAVAVDADWVFCPESPPDVEDWESAICNSIERRRNFRNYSLIIIAEGATDRVRRPISSEYVRKLLATRLNHDARVTCLGHVQRGGAPSAFDRLQGSLLGAEAAIAILAADDETPSRIIGLSSQKVIQIDLMTAVEKTRQASLLPSRTSSTPHKLKRLAVAGQRP